MRRLHKARVVVGGWRGPRVRTEVVQSFKPASHPVPGQPVLLGPGRRRVGSGRSMAARWAVGRTGGAWVWIWTCRRLKAQGSHGEVGVREELVLKPSGRPRRQEAPGIIVCSNPLGSIDDGTLAGHQLDGAGLP